MNAVNERFIPDVILKSLPPLVAPQKAAAAPLPGGAHIVPLAAISQAPDKTNSTPLALEKPSEVLDLMASLQLVLVKLGHKNIETSKEDLQFLAADNKAQHQDMVKAIQDATQAMKEAQKSQNISKIFGWIAAAATALVGAILIATGAGATAGAVMLVLAADQMVGMATGTSVTSLATEGIAKGLEAAGMEKTAASIVATVIITAVIIAVSVGAPVAAAMKSSTKAGAAAASQTAGAGANAAGQAVRSASQETARSALMMQSMQQARNVATGAGAGATIGQGATSIDGASSAREAGMSRAEQVMIRRVVEDNRADIETLAEHIKSVAQNIETAVRQMMENIITNHDTKQNLARSMA